jgi:hypothetical protein
VKYPPPNVHWLEVPGVVQVVIAAYDPERGWVSTKRGMLYGGHHGEPPLIGQPIEKVLEIVDREVHSGVRAIKARWEEP